MISNVFCRVFCLCILLISCDNTFEPFQENDQYAFSMYGTLDLYADTQWVRVMPVEQTLLSQETEPISVTVSLTHNSTGEEIEMEDSLFQFAKDAYAWNYWSPDIEVEPYETYLVRAEDPKSGESQAIVTMPGPLQMPVVEYDTDEEQAVITGQINDKLVVFETRYLAQVLTPVGCAPEQEVAISHIDEITFNADESFRSVVHNEHTIASKLGVLAGQYLINKRELIIITASSDWPDLEGFDENEISLVGVASNVEHGTGLIAGIAKRVVEITERRPPCETSR